MKIAVIGGDAAEGGIYVFDDVAAPAAGATPEPVVLYSRSPAYPIYLYWSPDGRRIAFITSEAAGLALQVVSADGSGSPVVVRRGSPMYWDWVDEAHLLVHSGADGPDAFVGEVGLDAPQSTAVSSSPGQFQAPGVAPTGGDRAYAVAPAPDGRRVVVEGADGSIRASAAVDGPTAVGWSPAGDRLAYITPVPASVVPIGRLDVMDARTGSTRTLLDGFVVAFFWAPDARTIAVIRLADASGETASVEPVATPGRGIRLTFVDAATGAVRSDREVRLPPLIIAQFVPFFDQYALSHRIWSATGEAIVLPLVDDSGESRVTIIPADGSPPARLADGVAAFWSP